MDVLIVETLNGGDVLVKGNDLATAQGFENMPYLALFGGNVEQSTPSIRVPGELNNDWWGNALIQSRAAQCNSDTERKLKTEPITAAGRVRMEATVKNDLKFMREFADINATVRVLDDDVIGISIRIEQPNNIQAKEFQYIWDGTQLALNGGTVTYEPPPAEVDLAVRLLEDGLFRLTEDGGLRLLQ